jgi:exodeoxyribonuclease V beta subunit
LHAGESTGKKNDALDAAGMRARLAALAAESGGDIAVFDVPVRDAANAFETTHAAEALAQHVAAALARQRASMGAVAPARKAQRRFAPELRLHSFSVLHARNEATTVPLLAARPGADDEAALRVEDDGETTLIGTAFGNAVHAVLEAADMTHWRLSRDGDTQTAAGNTARNADDTNDRARAAEDICPPAQRALLERALLRHGLDAGPAALAQTARLTHRALNLRLPGDLRLCDLDAQRMRAEMGFHFRLRPTRLDALQALLETHGYPRAQRLPQATLEGLMHGYIDLVYRGGDGRYYVLDYKTNRLPAYDPASLRQSIRQRDYDLQYLIYLVALRRWLRLRRGAAFDAERDLGGAVYLFLRGIELCEEDLNALHPQPGKTRKRDASVAAMQPSLFGFDARAGVHVDPVSPTLLAALDALFDGGDLGA